MTAFFAAKGPGGESRDDICFAQPHSTSAGKLLLMITGAHVLFYSADPEIDRAFFRDVLGFRNVDAGDGWLIFKLPPAEAAFHPIGGKKTTVSRGGDKLLGAVLYLMCDDLQAQMKSLKAKKVRCSPPQEVSWGIQTSFRLPSGGAIGLYQPKHPTAFNLR